jgi:hypothetical protein
MAKFNIERLLSAIGGLYFAQQGASGDASIIEEAGSAVNHACG